MDDKQCPYCAETTKVQGCLRALLIGTVFCLTIIEVIAGLIFTALGAVGGIKDGDGLPQLRTTQPNNSGPSNRKIGQNV
jgi:hypothetical protein